MSKGRKIKTCTILRARDFHLPTELSEARNNYSLGKLEKRIQKSDLLILDEMGYVIFDRYQSELLFKIIADRSGHGSIIVTTNLPFSK
ncbi:MAG: ATP-binding protein [Lachnospiraceae bacterium]|nr:ATP-binding protein [Lachnospiraceae bacterium]